MANLNLQIDFTEDIQETGFLYKDFDIKFENTAGTSPTVLAQHIDVSAIQQGIYNIFHWGKGERILLPDFGTDLKKFLYEGITDKLKQDIREEITKSINKWEPRVSIVRVKIEDGVQYNEPNTLFVQIEYTIPTLGDSLLNFQAIISNKG